MNTLKKISFSEIKKFLKKYSIDVSSNLNDSDTFLNIKTLSHANEDDLSFFSNIIFILFIFNRYFYQDYDYYKFNNTF